MTEIVAKDNVGNAYTIKDGVLYKENGEEYVVENYNDVIRPLSQREREIYSSAVVEATAKILPAFRDSVAVLRPFFDLTSTTAYTDINARCGLGPWFFSSELDPNKRASILLHEAMHVLNDHFVRGDNFGRGISPGTLNKAGDFEINSALDKIPAVTLRFTENIKAIFPDETPYDYPPNLFMEEYLELLLKDREDEKCPKCGGTGKEQSENSESSDNSDEGQNNQGGASGNEGQESGAGGEDQADTGGQSGEEGDGSRDGSGSGSGGSESKDCDACKGTGEKQCDGNCNPNGYGKSCNTCKSKAEGCGSSNEQREAAADAAGIEKASEAEKQISARNTTVRIAEEAKKQRQAGYGHADNFYELMTKILTPPKVDWRTIFRQVTSSVVDIAARGRQDYSYRRPNRRFSNSKYIFPGMIQYEPSSMIGIDTSGSMSQNDYLAVLAEVESIVRSVTRGRNKLRVFTVDTEISNIQTVGSVKELNLVGGGGTRMSSAFEYVNSLPRREIPDIFVLATDAGLFGDDWTSIVEAINNAPKKYTPIILITCEGAIDTVPESVKAVAKVIDVS